MKKKIVLILMSLLVGIGSIAAQSSLTAAQKRDFNRKALELFDKYKRFSDQSSVSDSEEFIKLFSPGAKLGYGLTKELPGVAPQRQLTLEEYTDLLREEISSSLTSFASVRKGQPRLVDGKWLMNISFDKSQSYITGCNAVMETSQYYGDWFHCVMTIEYDPMAGTCKIVALDSTIDSPVPVLRRDHTIVGRIKPFKQNVTANGTLLRFDSYGQAFVNGTADELKFRTDDPYARVRSVRSGTPGDKCSRVKVGVKPLRFAVRPAFSYSLMNPFSFDEDPKYDGFENEGSGFEVGLDLGYYLKCSLNFRIGFFIGARFSLSKNRLFNSDFKYSYFTYEDIDGDSYYRNYDCSYLENKSDNTSLAFPVTIEFDYSLSRRVSVFGKIGVKPYIGLGQEGNKSTFDYEYNVWGLYPQYGNLIIDSPVYNGFGSHSGSYESYLNKSLSMDGFGGVGLRVNIAGPLSADLSLSYQLPIIKQELSYANWDMFEYYMNTGEIVTTPYNKFRGRLNHKLMAEVGLMIQF